MAEQLGSAVLTVSVDDQQLKVGLQAAERQAKATGQNIEQAFTKSGKPIQTAVNGLQYFVDAQGKARDIAGKFLTIAQQQEAGLAGIGTAAAGAGRGLGGFGGAVDGIGATAAGAAVSVAAIGAAIVGIGAASVQSAGGIQRLNAAFVGLTGSAEAAKQLRQDLFTLSKTTPFKNEEILQAAQRFLAVGVEVDKLQGTINRVGAIAAQSGQPLERLALIYAQVYAKGRLQGEENLQLLEAGVDLTQELSAVTGKSGTALQDAMSKGQIGINDFNKALLLATGEMSALQLAGRAVDVQFNNVFDNLGQLFGGFAQAIAPALSASFKVINDIFDTAFPSLESITKFFEPLTQAAERFSKTLEGNPQLIAAIAAGFKSIGSVVIENIVIGLDTVRSILSKIDGKELIKGLIQVELLLRKALLAGRALSATIIKNAELTFRGITNPVQFGKDIFAAGGFKAFIEKEYGQVYQYWTAAAQAKPLPFPDVQQKTQQPTQGDLSNKPLSNEDLKKRWADSIAAANRIRSIQEQTAIESARPGLTGIGIGALSALAAFREAQRQEQNAQAQLRINPGDTALQSAANEAAENVKLAAAKTKADLQDAFKAAQDSVRAISRSIEDSVLALQQAQNQRGAGLNEFLSPQQVTDRQQQVNQQLSGAANELIKQLRDQLGLNVQFRLTGTTEQRNAALGRFLTSGRQEVRAAEDIRRQQEDLKKAQADLAVASKSNDAFGKMIAQNRIDIASGRGDTASTMNALATSTVNQTVETKKLTDAIAALTSKPWDVVVNVAANGQASVYGDAVNGGF